MEYRLTRTCKDCKNIDSYIITKLEAAFELYDSKKIWNTTCSRCGSKKCESLGHQHPTLDQELLDFWGNNSELSLMQQDEELLLAEIEYFPMILKAIDESKYIKSKINVLIESICVLLYDNTVSSEEYSEQENKKRDEIAAVVRLELIKRKDKIIEVEEVVMDYIKKVVFPQIGIELDNV